MTTLADRIRAALDATERLARLVEYSGPGGSRLLLRTIAAHRKILDLWDGTVEVRDVAWDKFRAGETPTEAESRDATHAERELAALQVVLEALAEAYGVEA